MENGYTYILLYHFSFIDCKKKGGKYMKNPNGYGSVVKLSGNRRKPYWIRKTVGWNEKGYPIYSTIGYAKTREEGNIILAEYNRNPWNVDATKITLQELFNLWLEKKCVKLGVSNQNSLKSAYNYINKLSDMKYVEIKAYQMQDCIDSCGKSYSMQSAIKNLWAHLDKFALELDITSKNYSSLLVSDPIPQTSRERFSDDEIKTVWKLYKEYSKGKHFDNLPIEWIDTVLIFLYSAFRISELLSLKTENVNLDNLTFKGGTKTAAGKNRIVPIHSAILPIIKNRYDFNSEYFININGKPISPSSYRLIWKSLMHYMKINKTPHECRHTFESILDSNGANRKCIDLMMGHASKDVGNRIYNHKTLEELRTAIELFKVN